MKTPLLPSRSSMKAELRVHPRVSLRGPVTVAWRDANRRIRQFHSITRNVSGGGALVQSYRALPVGSIVRIRSRRLFFLPCCARLQHCSRRVFTSQIVLQLEYAPS